jgi:hypothetical protein
MHAMRLQVLDLFHIANGVFAGRSAALKRSGNCLISLMVRCRYVRSDPNLDVTPKRAIVSDVDCVRKCHSWMGPSYLISDADVGYGRLKFINASCRS